MAEFQTPIKRVRDADGGSDKITIPPSPFLHRLGYGTGVSVMQLVRSPKAGQIRSPWALKMLNKRVKPCQVYTDRLQAEAELLKKMSHPNIVGFRAFSKDKILYLGMEACDLSLGDLIEKRVEDDSFQIFTPRQILKVSADISSALDYLHTKMKILHGDMKSFNILVNGDFVICKLCDFGVTLQLDENGVVDSDQANGAIYYGTEAWSAPETMNGGTLTSKCDIWSLGLTLWEMMSLMPPHSDFDDDTLDSSVTDMDSSNMSDTMERPFSDKFGTRPLIPVNISEERYSDPLGIFYCCTETEQNLRPTAANVHQASIQMMEGSNLN